MINKTNIPVLLDSNIKQEALDNAIRSTIEFTCSHKNEAKQLFERGLKNKELYDLKFIISCFDFVMLIKNAREHVNIEVSKLAHNLIRSINENNTVNINIRILHSSVKIILVHLWHEKLILLPLEFRTGTTFSYKSATSSELMNKLLTPVALFISKYPGGSNSLLGHEYLTKWNTDELSKSGWRLFLSTSFHTFSDFNIDEFSELSEILFTISPHYREISGYKNTGISPILKTLYVEYLENHSEDIKITKKDILSFNNWRKQSEFSYSSFRTFRNFSSEEIKSINKKKLNERKKNSAQKKSLLRRFDNESSDDSSNKRNIDFTVNSVQKDLELIISLNDHESAIQYFKRCQYINNSFKRDIIVYPGCDFLPVIDGTNIWIKTIRNYITYRENQGLTIEGSVSNANILIDYLFFYLRFWKKLYNHIDFNPPYTPDEFNRALHFKYRFVVELSDAEQSIDVYQRPLTLLEILEASGRRSTGYSINSFIEFIDQLFAYIIADKTAYPEIADKFISNPVHQKIDKTHVHRHRESVKEDIPEALFYILWLYFEALENFGIEWLNNTISDPLSSQDDLMNEMPEFFHAWELGMEIPTFIYKGSIFEIDPIPNVFFPHHRTIKIKDGKLDQNGKPEKRLVPVLTSLRLTYSIAGMAIRGQSVQWLDREKFDLPNLNNPTEDDYYLINVSTDKVKKVPWNTLCHKKIRDVLLREQSWQLSTEERCSKKEIKYENRKNPPQGRILPLFRSSGKNPVDDKFYYRTWELAWLSLHSIISSNKDKIAHDKDVILRGISGCLIPMPAYPKGYEDIKGMHIVTYPDTTPKKKKKKKPFHQRRPNSNLHKRKYSKPSIVGPFCEVKYEKRYIPHSSRVSHATILADHGIPPELIQEITGQTIPLVRYYIKNKQKRLINALKQTSIFDTSEPVHLHPSSPSSAMAKNLSNNVDEAILQHKFALFDLRDPSLRGGTDALGILKAYGVDKCDVDDHRLCVAGGKCPTDALESIKEPNRCALCHYSLYGIDHQPGILARIEALRGECTAASRIIKTHNLNESHQSKKLVKTVSYKRSLDLLELSVYEKILTYLEQATKDRADDDYHFFYTQDPDVISQQLELRSQNGGLDEFLYLRFSQCREYKHLAIDNTLVKHANLLARRLSVKLDKDDTTIEDIPDTYTLIDLLWNQIVTIANIEGKSIRQIHSELLSLPSLQTIGPANLLENRC